MAISYNKLWKLLIDKLMRKAELRRAAGIAPNTFGLLETVGSAVFIVLRFPLRQ